MKKIILVTSLVFLTMKVFSQSVTLNELQHLLSAADQDKFLSGKLFKILQKQSTKLSKPPLVYYIKNDHNANSEMITIGLGFTNKNGIFVPDICYSTKDTSYINTFIKQIYHSNFQLTNKKIDAKKYSFRFKKDNLHIMVYKKKDGSESQVYLLQSF